MRPGRVVPAALLLLTACVYHEVGGHAFVDFDDYVTIVHNPTHQAPLSSESIVRALGAPYHLNWIPLTALSLQLDAALWGTRAGPTLLTNAALHAIGALLLWLALTRLTGAPWRCGFVAAVFAVHPLHVESVAWASQRKDVLAGVFFGLTLLAYACWRERPGFARYLGLLGAFALGLLAKPTLVTAPFVLLLLDDWPLGRLRDAAGRLSWTRVRGALREKLPLFGVAAAAAALTFVVQSAYGAKETLGHLPFPVRLGNACVAYVAYLRSAFWPVGLIPDYPHPGLELSPVYALVCGGILVLLSVLALRSHARQPWLPVGWLWFLGMLVPMIGLVQVGVQARADRYTYLPLTGIAIVCAFGVADRLRSGRGRRVAVGVGVAAILALAFCGARQVRHWRDTTSLFERAVAIAPQHAVAHRALGIAYGRQKDLARSEAHYDAFFALEPDAARARFEWASLLEHDGRLDEALVHYTRGVELEPDFARGRGFLALALQRSGRFEDSLPHFRYALAVHDAPELRRGLAHALAGLGRHGEAMQQRRAWLRLEPGSAEAKNELAWALATCPDARLRAPGEALALSEAATAAHPGDANLLDTLGAAYAANGRFAEAMRAARAAMRAAPDASLRAAYAERLARYADARPYIDRR